MGDADWSAYPRIAAARDHSRATLDELRTELAPLESIGCFVAASGSLGRLEATSGSDLDFAICVLPEYGGTPTSLDDVAVACRRYIEQSGKLKPPSTTGAFGETVDLHRIIEQTGKWMPESEGGDSNAALTHRMLLMTEATWLLRREAFDEGLERIRWNYLRHHQKRYGLL